MERRDITRFLSDLLISNRLSGIGKYYAREVTLDANSNTSKRVDFLQFEPENTYSMSGIEKGIFTCYEVKSCKEDVYSGNGLNFIGEKNYIVTTMQCYKELQEDMRSGKLWKHVQNCNPESSAHFGFIVPVPWMCSDTDEYENPTELKSEIRWNLKIIYPCRIGSRKRSMIELLFCMVRSGKN